MKKIIGLIVGCFFCIFLMNFVINNVRDVKQDEIPSKYMNKYYILKSERNNIRKRMKNLKDVTSYLPINYVKDATVDYTEFLQKALDENRSVILPNFPLMINDEGLKVKSNSVIIFNEKTKLIKSKTDKSNYDIIRIGNVNNVKIYFANIEGDRYEHITNKGEWGMGIGIWNSKYVQLISPNIKYCWGDGIYINNSDNISISRAVTNNNRRNGVSIISGENIMIDNLLSANNNGTAPKAGIDIEPNNNNERIKNVTLKNIITYNNFQGILISLYFLSGQNDKNVSINVDNHLDESSDYSFAMHLIKKERDYKPIIGYINISNMRWITPKKGKVLLHNNENQFQNNININVDDNNSLDRLTKEKLLKY